MPTVLKHQKPTMLLITIVIVMLVLIPSCTNTIILIRLLRKKFAPRVAYLFNISLCDTLASFFVMLNLFLHEVFYYFTLTFHIASFFATLLVSIDGYITIKYCLRYTTILTKKFVTISILISMLISVFLTGIGCKNHVQHLPSFFSSTFFQNYV